MHKKDRLGKEQLLFYIWNLENVKDYTENDSYNINPLQLLLNHSVKFSDADLLGIRTKRI